MSSTHETPMLLPDKPLFGLAFRHDSLQVMQTKTTTKHLTVTGYGTTTFDPRAIEQGVITRPRLIADPLLQLFTSGLSGHISTRRVALAIPSTDVLFRFIQLPKLSPKDLRTAVRTELTHQMPATRKSSYIDYAITKIDNESYHLAAVAAPQVIIDSYLALTRLVGLRAMLVEPTVVANMRLLARHHTPRTEASVIIDIGAHTTDISIVHSTILAAQTIAIGTMAFSQAIQQTLHTTPAQATIIRDRYGLGMSKKQLQIVRALEPSLKQIVQAVRLCMDTHNEEPIGQIIIVGSCASMPGLNEYIINALRMPARLYDPWQHITTAKKTPPPSIQDRLQYTTVAGVSTVHPGKLYI